MKHVFYYISAAADALLEGRTRRWIRPRGLLPLGRARDEDKELSRIVIHTRERGVRIVLPPSLVPWFCCRSMSMVVATWLTADGAELGVFCQDCLYTYKQDIICASEDFEEHAKSCEVRVSYNRAMHMLFMRRHLGCDVLSLPVPSNCFVQRQRMGWLRDDYGVDHEVGLDELIKKTNQKELIKKS
jgi:hypothetical protein